MPFLNTLIQRLGIFAVFAVVGYALMIFSSAFGPSMRVAGLLPELLMFFIYFGGYIFFYRRGLALIPRVRALATRPAAAKIIYDIVFPTLVFTLSYELVSLVVPQYIVIPSVFQLFFNMLGLFTFLGGVICALNYKRVS